MAKPLRCPSRKVSYDAAIFREKIITNHNNHDDPRALFSAKNSFAEQAGTMTGMTYMTHMTILIFLLVNSGYSS
jgi:hypothetical protein